MLKPVEVFNPRKRFRFQKDRVMPDSEFPEYGRKLTEVADRMKDYGVRMVYHHHMGTVIETEREVDLLMEHTGPSVELLIDTGHLTFAGGNVEATTPVSYTHLTLPTILLV